MSSRTNTVIRWFRLLWAGSPGALAAIVGLSLVNAVLVTAFPWFWRDLVEEMRRTADPVTMKELALIMAGVGVAQTCVYLALQSLRSIMNSRIQWRARNRVFEHVSAMDPAFFRRWRTGDLVTRLTDDCSDKLSWFLCSGVFRTLEASLVVIACLIAMATIDWRLTLWVIVPLPLLIVGQALAQGALERRYREVQGAISGINDELSATFGGIRIVQASGLGPQARARFVEQAEGQRAAEVRTAMIQQCVNLMYGYGWQLAVVALLIAGGSHVIRGDLSLGAFVAFEGFVMTLIWPMFDVGMFLSRYKQTFVTLGRLDELLAEPTPPAPTGTEQPGEPRLAVDGVRVVAADGTELLADVGFALHPGQLLAVVGAVGAGKSTLMELLAGAREPSAGSLTVGGMDVGALDYGALRALIASVPQDPVLISTTLRENILLGREVEEHTLQRALTISRLAQDLPAFSDGLETTVGERGVTLSGGQQQRVGLARALVGGPRILLLDDATAALDADTEAAFWSHLEELLPDVTAVVVTHRVATIQRADQVLVLEGGRPAQLGTHDALAAEEGAYRRIYGRYAASEQVGQLSGGWATVAAALEPE